MVARQETPIERSSPLRTSRLLWHAWQRSDVTNSSGDSSFGSPAAIDAGNSLVLQRRVGQGLDEYNMAGLDQV